MTPLSDIELAISVAAADSDPARGAAALLALGEDVLSHWIEARGETSTTEEKEGYRLLALHRQGCKDVPSFNACRETCRELVYHRNLIDATDDPVEAKRTLQLMGMVAMHLYLFVSGKMQVAGLGEFCCSSKPLHAAE